MLYETPPGDFRPRMQFAAVFVKYKNNVLLGLRQPSQFYGNVWSMPGAKVKVDDDAHDVVVRELRENVGLDIPKIKIEYYNTFSIRTRDIDFIYNIYQTEVSSKEGVITNSRSYKGYVWATPDEAFKLPLAPDEETCLKKLFGVRDTPQKTGVRNEPFRTRL